MKTEIFDIKISPLEKSSFENEGSFLQTPFWCNFKSRHGWKYQRFLVYVKIKNQRDLNPLKKDSHMENSTSPKDIFLENSNTSGENPLHKSNVYDFFGESYEKSFELAVLNRFFAKNLLSISYIPLMPSLPFECTKKEVIDMTFESENAISQELITAEGQTIEFAFFLRELSLSLKPYLPKNTIAIRFDPDVTFDTAEERDAFNYGMKLVNFADKLGVKKSKVDIQPPDSTIIDLTLSEDEILSKMHQKWRYNIRLSEKKGVTVHKYDGKSLNLSEKIDKFYQLTLETNARDGNSSHAKSYYYDLIQSSSKEILEGVDVPLVNLYIAEHEGDEIAAIMTLFSKSEAIYLYGASSNLKRNLMPNYALQWTAIKDAKAYGSLFYDMYGMPPEGKDQNHPMHGLYMFKANFGGRNIHRIGSYDFPLKFFYVFYKLIENFRAWYFKVLRKKIRGR